jgi:hypothetical protein
MSSPENQEFHVDLSFSAADTHKTYLIASIVAVSAIVFIVLTMTTSLAAHLLPMNDEYLQVLIPVAADGKEALGLKSLEHDINGNSASVRGTVENRTDYAISGVVAVIEFQDTTTRFPQTVEAAVDPVDLGPKQIGSFTASATLQQKVAGYLIRFKLAPDGPFLPHKDDRPTLGITPQ